MSLDCNSSFVLHGFHACNRARTQLLGPGFDEMLGLGLGSWDPIWNCGTRLTRGDQKLWQCLGQNMKAFWVVPEGCASIMVPRNSEAVQNMSNFGKFAAGEPLKLRLNVVNAVFVQQTMKTASFDEELAFKQKERDIVTYTNKVRRQDVRDQKQLSRLP